MYSDARRVAADTALARCSIGSSIATSTLIVLRELMDPHTRFAPYIKVSI
jgi:hypothetical protein